MEILQELLLELAKQSPLLGLCFFLNWYFLRRIDKQHERQLDDLQKQLQRCYNEKRDLLKKLFPPNKDREQPL